MHSSRASAVPMTKMARKRIQLQRQREKSRCSGHRPDRDRSRSRSPGLQGCRQCGMVYSSARSSDVRRHARYHRNHLDAAEAFFVRYSMAGDSACRGRRRIVKAFFNGDRIFQLTGEQRPPASAELAAVRLMRRDLAGAAAGDVEDDNDTACWQAAGCPGRIVLMFARPGQGIIGCCVAEPIRRAYNVELASGNGAGNVEGHPNCVEFNSISCNNFRNEASENGSVDAGRGADDNESCENRDFNDASDNNRHRFNNACSFEPSPDDSGHNLQAFLCRSDIVARASCGIYQIWCRTDQRRTGVATALLDAVREVLSPGLILDRLQVAFCSPSPAGYQLARAYVGGDRWVLVY